MIDLNYQPKKKKTEDEDVPMGVLIISLLPFAVLFYVVLTASFLNGIY